MLTEFVSNKICYSYKYRYMYFIDDETQNCQVSSTELLFGDKEQGSGDVNVGSGVDSVRWLQ